MTVAEGSAVVIVCIACIYDVSSSRVPNALTFAAASLAVLVHVLAPSGEGLSHAFLGLVVGLLVFFPLFALGAMGAGDVKLMAAVGAWIGASSIIYVALYASVAGGIMALVVAIRQRYLGTLFSNIKALGMYWWIEGVKPFPALTLESSKSLRLPYALAIAAGLALTLWQR